jgi:sortase A
VSEAAAAFREDLEYGDELGTIEFASGERVTVRAGLSQEAIDRGGAAWYGAGADSTLPGEGGLVYVAGHRTTHGAPFRPVGSLRPGDEVKFTVPYATAVYTVTHRRLAKQRDLRILEASGGTEELRLQTSMVPPTSRRVIVFARLSSIEGR